MPAATKKRGTRCHSCKELATNSFQETSNIVAVQKHESQHFFPLEIKKDLPSVKDKETLGPRMRVLFCFHFGWILPD